MEAPINKDYDIGRVDSNVPINNVDERIKDSLTLNFNSNINKMGKN